LLQAVLATDMSVHADFMQRFQQELNGHREPLFQRQILACQALLKNADISNPVRCYNSSDRYHGLMSTYRADRSRSQSTGLRHSCKSGLPRLNWKSTFAYNKAYNQQMTLSPPPSRKYSSFPRSRSRCYSRQWVLSRVGYILSTLPFSRALSHDVLYPRNVPLSPALRYEFRAMANAQS
jgi:hypothetical protein